MQERQTDKENSETEVGKEWEEILEGTGLEYTGILNTVYKTAVSICLFDCIEPFTGTDPIPRTCPPPPSSPTKTTSFREYY